jgi:hypothetical protein
VSAAVVSIRAFELSEKKKTKRTPGPRETVLRNHRPFLRNTFFFLPDTKKKKVHCTPQPLMNGTARTETNEDDYNE